MGIKIIRATKKPPEDLEARTAMAVYEHLALRRPPAAERCKGETENAQSIAGAQAPLQLSPTGVDICHCDAHG
jgi:hypothetical protein